ncbi:ribosome recycling factor family protein [Vibrio sp. SCSIO 43136]|uniref:ribosome recycling factor family protein n=1 Tax=Vibrio sp. SCSIO 43136 TaxID=2819101 RepID=UPI002076419B|nr:ribosome recycling factor family protein [Vibrio sp. SCSIO 43136]USD67547.1 ribosome recycling factor family protein [Vibrio sp. SCSIO 43136]
MENEIITVPLPSLIHRMGSDVVKQARVLAQSQGCELKRVRRSRNWQLLGEAAAILSLQSQLRRDHSSEMRFMIDKIAAVPIEVIPQLSLEEQLIALVVANPNITLSEMMAETDCSVAQARTARFEAESLD